MLGKATFVFRKWRSGLADVLGFCCSQLHPHFCVLQGQRAHAAEPFLPYYTQQVAACFLIFVRVCPQSFISLKNKIRIRVKHMECIIKTNFLTQIDKCYIK